MRLGIHVCVVACVFLSSAGWGQNLPTFSPGSPAGKLQAAGISLPTGLGKPHICSSYYPDSAIRDRASGVATLSFRILENGTLGNLALEETSGNDALDRASLACVLGWQYKPAMKDGNPVAVEWKARVVWSLVGTQLKRNHPAYLLETKDAEACFAVYPPKASQAGISGNTLLGFTVDTHGRVKDVKVFASSGNADLDEASARCTALQRYEAAYQNDEAIETPHKRNVAWKMLGNAIIEPKVIARPTVCWPGVNWIRKHPEAFEGETALSFTVTDGKADDFSIKGSSGDNTLDEAAIKCVKSQWRFEVVTNAGKPMPLPGSAIIPWKIVSKPSPAQPSPK